MLTRRAKYGLIALNHLADRPAGIPVLIEDLAREERIPKKYLERILLDLKRHGILQSRKGKGGGYFLNRHPRDILIGDVLRIMDGPLAPVPCVSHTAYAPCPECREEASCRIKKVMKKVRDAIGTVLDETTLEQMARNRRK
ncbi:MAG TPA: Rrf2 family transcriptional regulator [Kiritimatiellia bacterium]|nr:Rrf2 family transcriptional regulator [Kiritimatiellia bacterium]